MTVSVVRMKPRRALEIKRPGGLISFESFPAGALPGWRNALQFFNELDLNSVT
jgi:hypothetical protein